MNKKGFTLVELLFVVVLMAIIAMITMPNIFDMLSSSKTKKYEEYEKVLIENLKLYNIDHREELWSNEESIRNITYEDLLTANPDINIAGCSVLNYLVITKDGSNYTYKVCLECTENDNNTVYYPKHCNEW